MELKGSKRIRLGNEKKKKKNEGDGCLSRLLIFFFVNEVLVDGLKNKK